MSRKLEKHFALDYSQRRLVFLVLLVGMPLAVREGWSEEDEDVHESGAHERRPALPRSVSAKDGLQRSLSR